MATIKQVIELDLTDINNALMQYAAQKVGIAYPYTAIVSIHAVSAGSYQDASAKIELTHVEKSAAERLSAIQGHYRLIMTTTPVGYRRDKELSRLMDIMKHEFDVPLLRNEGWEREHPAEIALYRQIANSRGLD